MHDDVSAGWGLTPSSSSTKSTGTLQLLAKNPRWPMRGVTPSPVVDTGLAGVSLCQNISTEYQQLYMIIQSSPASKVKVLHVVIAVHTPLQISVTLNNIPMLLFTHQEPPHNASQHRFSLSTSGLSKTFFLTTLLYMLSVKLVSAGQLITINHGWSHACSCCGHWNRVCKLFLWYIAL